MASDSRPLAPPPALKSDAPHSLPPRLTPAAHRLLRAPAIASLASAAHGGNDAQGLGRDLRPRRHAPRHRYADPIDLPRAVLSDSPSGPPVSCESFAAFDAPGSQCCFVGAERATRDVLNEFLAAYGKVPDKEKEERRLGQMYRESTTGIIADYGLPLTVEEYAVAIYPLYLKRFVSC
jgi:hypothetical protein